MKGFAMSLAMMLLLTGCESMPGQTTYVDDAAINSSIKGKLVTERVGNLQLVGVDTTRGTVYLSGVVPSHDHKMRAEQLAREALGVKAVVNNLQVQPAVDDPSITSLIKGKFQADRLANLERINVETTAGTVYLNGVVPSTDHKMRAEQLAREVRGVNQVSNNLQVQPSIDDLSITASIKGKLQADRVANLARVNVDTTAGTVYLNGVVPSNDHKMRAEQLAREVRGVNQVVNNLQVQQP